MKNYRIYRMLNWILFPLALLAAVGNYETWKHSSGLAAGQVNATATGKTDPPAPPSSDPREKDQPALADHSYGVIAGRNIFSPDRKEFLSPEQSSARQPGTHLRPRVFLHGVVLGDDYQSASVSSPGRALRKGERETMTLKPGDRVGEYRLARISDDRITLEAAGDSFEVLLYDRLKPRGNVAAYAAGQPAAEMNAAATAPPTPAPVETARAESLDRRAAPSTETAVAPAPPLPRETPLEYSREARSRRYANLSRGLGIQPYPGIAEGARGNRDKAGTQ